MRSLSITLVAVAVVDVCVCKLLFVDEDDSVDDDDVEEDDDVFETVTGSVVIEFDFLSFLLFDIITFNGFACRLLNNFPLSSSIDFAACDAFVYFI